MPPRAPDIHDFGSGGWDSEEKRTIGQRLFQAAVGAAGVALGVTVGLSAVKYGLQLETFHHSFYVPIPDGAAEVLVVTGAFGGAVSVAGAIAVGDAIRH